MADVEKEELDESEGTASADAKKLLRDVGIWDGGEPVEAPIDKEAANRFLTVVRNDDAATSFVASLFPADIPGGTAFFDRLSELRCWLGVGSSADEGIGIVWSKAFERLDDDARTELLTHIIDLPGHRFFEHVGGLPVIVTSHELPAEFLAGWLPELLKAVKGDVTAGVWSVVTSLCESRTGTALKVLKELANRVDDEAIDLVAVLLGKLRTRRSEGEPVEGLEKQEARLKNSPDPRVRASYNWSWVTTVRAVGISKEGLASLLDRADAGADDDVVSVVGVAGRLIADQQIAEDIRIRCCDWLNSRIGSSLPPHAKYYVACAGAAFARRSASSAGQEPDWASWLVAIQPVERSDAGTWRETLWSLESLAKKDTGRFTSVFEAIGKVSAGPLLALADETRHVEPLLHSMKGLAMKDVVARLALSSVAATRRFGLFLFNALECVVLPKEVVEESGKTGARLLHYELQCRPQSPEATARLLVSLFRNACESNDPFRQELIDEIALQARNYPGRFRAELELRGADLPDLVTLLDAANNFFKQLQAAHEAGVNAMQVPGSHRAATLYRRRISRETSEAAKEHSTLLSLFKHIDLIYGGESGAFDGRQLSKASPLTPFSSSVEIPLLELCDPEQMALHRLQAAAKISQLLDK